LTLKVGALGLLQTLRRLGKQVIVITEGPADAQEWTAKELGLWSYIDILVTTNEIGKSKVDGLFGVVLEKYGISADEIVYFGDNEVRDVKAAQREGILAVLYDEKQRCQLGNWESLRIDSWEQLVLVVGLES
jgi:putative hydrolase of the HAD superfamily